MNVSGFNNSYNNIESLKNLAESPSINARVEAQDQGEAKAGMRSQARPEVTIPKGMLSRGLNALSNGIEKRCLFAKGQIGFNAAIIFSKALGKIGGDSNTPMGKLLGHLTDHCVSVGRNALKDLTKQVTYEKKQQEGMKADDAEKARVAPYKAQKRAEATRNALDQMFPGSASAKKREDAKVQAEMEAYERGEKKVSPEQIAANERKNEAMMKQAFKPVNKAYDAIPKPTADVTKEMKDVLVDLSSRSSGNLASKVLQTQSYFIHAEKSRFDGETHFTLAGNNKQLEIKVEQGKYTIDLGDEKFSADNVTALMVQINKKYPLP